MAAVDTHVEFTRGVESPASNIALVTPHDTNELGYATRGISFGTAGALKVKTRGGQTVTIPDGALAAGIIHPIEVVQVFDTGTDADGIVAYW